jgi:IS1 family transposase
MSNYYVSAEKRTQILSLLVEGNSVRGTARLVKSQHRTVLRYLVEAGEKARQFLHRQLRDLHVKHIQVDECWTFIGKKERRLTAEDRMNPELGDQYLFMAMDRDSKLICTYAIGKRDGYTTERFIDDLARRMVLPQYTHDPGMRPTISTDGFPPYAHCVPASFGASVNYGQVIKNYAEGQQEGRYGPPRIVSVDRRPLAGEINPYSLCTSHIERVNLTARTWLKRFCRLSLGFSRKLDNLRAAVALFVYDYNFCRIHSTLGKTPAMAAKVTMRPWTMADLYERMAA